MSRSRPRSVLGLFALVALGAAGAWAQVQPPQPSPPQPQAAALSARSLEPPGGVLVAPGNAPDVIFLYTGDVIGYVEPCG